MLSEDLKEKLLNRPTPFITVATCNSAGEPNAAPKLLLKVEKNTVYLVDVPFGRTWENLKENGNIALSFVDAETLKCYQMKGSVTVIDAGSVHEKMGDELNKKLERLTVTRIIEGMRRERAYKNFIIEVSKEFVVFKVKINDVVEFGMPERLRGHPLKTIPRGKP